MISPALCFASSEAGTGASGPWWVGPLVTLIVGFLGGGVLGGFVVERYKSRVQDKREQAKRLRDAGDVVTRAVVAYEAAVVEGGNDLQAKLTELMVEVAPCLPDLPRGLSQLVVEVEQASRWAVVTQTDLGDQAPSEAIRQLEGHTLALALLLREQLLRWSVYGHDRDVPAAREAVFERLRMMARLGGYDLVPTEGRPFGPPD